MSCLIASYPKPFAWGISLACALFSTVWQAAAIDFDRQHLILPGAPKDSMFLDVGGQGRFSLLAMDSTARKLQIFQQRNSSFSLNPDQTIELPAKTGWITVANVDDHAGLELVMSTGSGVVYCRQTGGKFEEEQRTLINAAQLFGTNDPPTLISTSPNAAIPVLSERSYTLHYRTNSIEWAHGNPVSIESQRAHWKIESARWSLGSKASRALRVEHSFSSQPDEGKSFENPVIDRLMDDLKKASAYHEPGWSRADLDRDGKKDLVIWQSVGEMEVRTDVYVFLRAADGKSPERPNQVLHCSGFPIPVGSTQKPSPIGDLDQDGAPELVLLELKHLTLLSASSVIETALSQGLDWVLSVRSFGKNGFARSPDARLIITTMIAVGTLPEWPVFVCGDFNLDGRHDFVVRRSTTLWNIFLSRPDARRFDEKPGMTFETVQDGYFDVQDLNGDKRSDLIQRSREKPDMFIYLAKPNRNRADPR